MRISAITNNFKGVYVSRQFEPGEQYNTAQAIAKSLRESGQADEFEHQGKDLYILPMDNGNYAVKVKRTRVDAILNDDFSRWYGNFN
ncbi:hypothetical protein IJ531_04800 [bacterium]|nr:hypothetical protein [bacterium]